ncbi:oxidoreductase-like domain-containing protein [Pseudoalteromonas sp. T1lg23B]|uniref:oxidoreductase-like domain-containing protein n=1 Tax=Pseudoalteromonas sp. T1lg23B TaxID=2077097 RepID=UPI000CF72BF0|nr:oxidoreductase-like domain-containing protein [Pseudoalteromonas sp. T1lg23B]
MSTEANTAFLEEPKKPKSDECCGGGSCCPCVWDLYRQKRQAWLKYQQQKIFCTKNEQTN